MDQVDIQLDPYESYVIHMDQVDSYDLYGST